MKLLERLRGLAAPEPAPAAPGRNDPCRCGSGRKYKRCCLAADETLRAQRRATALAPAKHSHGPDCGCGQE